MQIKRAAEVLAASQGWNHLPYIEETSYMRQAIALAEAGLLAIGSQPEPENSLPTHVQHQASGGIGIVLAHHDVGWTADFGNGAEYVTPPEFAPWQPETPAESDTGEPWCETHGQRADRCSYCAAEIANDPEPGLAQRAIEHAREVLPPRLAAAVARSLGDGVMADDAHTELAAEVLSLIEVICAQPVQPSRGARLKHHELLTRLIDRAVTDYINRWSNVEPDGPGLAKVILDAGYRQIVSDDASVEKLARTIACHEYSRDTGKDPSGAAFERFWRFLEPKERQDYRNTVRVVLAGLLDPRESDSCSS